MKHAIHVIVLIMLGCGPKPAPDVDEPGDDGPATIESDGPSEGTDPGSVDETDDDEAAADDSGEAVAEEEAGPKEIVGSASQEEVQPIEEKEYNVDVGVDFEAGPDAEGKQAVMQKVGEAGLQITMCYRKLVLDEDDLQGDMKVDMKILPGGATKNVTVVENTTGSDKLAACTLKELKKPKYPKKLNGKSPAAITVTLEFRPYLK